MSKPTLQEPEEKHSNDALIEAARRRWSPEDCDTSEWSPRNWTNARLALALAERLEKMSNQKRS